MIIDGFQYTQVTGLPDNPYPGLTVFLGVAWADMEPGVYTYNGVEWTSGTGTSRSAKDPVRVATTSNLAALSGLLTVDGIDLNVADRVLVKDQDVPEENGIYEAAVGGWRRSPDCDSDKEFVSGMICMVQEGTTNADTGWVFTTDGTITVGTTPIHWSQFSGTGNLSAGAGLQRIGSTILLSSTGVTPGTYKRVAVDSQGRITSGDNPNTLLGMGITDAQTIITGAASSVTVNDLLPDRIAGTDANGKLTDTEITVQEMQQIKTDSEAVAQAVANKQDKITGAITSVLAVDLTPNSAVVADAQGKMQSHPTVTSTELGHLAGLTENVQTQLDNRLDLTAGGTVAGATEFVEPPTTPTGVVRKQDLDLAVSAQQVIPRSIYASLPGLIVPFEGTLRWYPPIDSQLSSVTAFAGTAPGTTPIEVDIKKNGTSIIPDGETLLIPIGQNESATLVLPLVELLRTDYLTIDIVNGDGADGGIRIDYSAKIEE